MSGTSLDGIDVAVIDINGKRFETVAYRTTSYAPEVRERLLAVSNAQTHTAEISRLNFLLPEMYAKALKRCGVPLDTIQLIGCHGQTIFHERGNTLQIGDGSVLAERTGVPVVSDFRPRDIAAGGRGAPLVPFVDFLLFRHPNRGRVALNIGGIGNITAIPAGGSEDDVVAFDTGPGNMVMDQLVNIATNGSQSHDHNGVLAAKGHIQRDLLDHWLAAPYFRQRPPKTAGREQYGREFVNQALSTGLPLPDLIATATAFTAAAVGIGIRKWVRHPVDDVIVSGGGVHNRTLIAYLQGYLPNTRVQSSAEHGMDPDAKEAIAFAVLAYQTWRKQPGNLPSATGARRRAILGKISY
jgi:anhydro-N-acetylmuramic acid kinase